MWWPDPALASAGPPHAPAAHPGISRRLVAYPLETLSIPRTVSLACKYLDGTLGRIQAA